MQKLIKWMYTEEDINSTDTPMKQINDAGLDKWELVQILSKTEGRLFERAIFKRPLIDYSS